MGLINVTQYDQTPGQMGDANQINSAFSTIQTVINGNLEDVNIKTAAAIAASKIVRDTDPTLSANSDANIASQKAVKAYADAISSSLNPGPWTSAPPTWTGLTVGNGTNTGRYTQLGKSVTYETLLTLGSTSSVTGPVTMSLPANSRVYANGWQEIGNCTLPSYPNSYTGGIVGVYVDGTKIAIKWASLSPHDLFDLGSAIPFTWVTGGKLWTQYIYEAA